MKFRWWNFMDKFSCAKSWTFMNKVSSWNGVASKDREMLNIPKQAPFGGLSELIFGAPHGYVFFYIVFVPHHQSLQLVGKILGRP